MQTSANPAELKEGIDFPDFTLLNQDGQTVTRADLLGQPTVIYFYPKDDTSGCTAEACAFRDTMPRFQNLRVLGVSPDSVKSHKKFSEKYSLNFDLLADVDQALSQAVGVWVEKSMYGKQYMGVERSTFLLDKDGVIRRIWRKVKVDGHAAEVEQAATALA